MLIEENHIKNEINNKGTKIINKKYNICDEEIDVQIRFYVSPSNDLGYVASFLYFTLSNIYKSNNEMDLNIQNIFQKTFKYNISVSGFRNFSSYIKYNKEKIEKIEKIEKSEKSEKNTNMKSCKNKNKNKNKLKTDSNYAEIVSPDGDIELGILTK